MDKYINPEDVQIEKAKWILAFLNSAKTAQEIADAVEIPRERDVGIRVARNILARREELGGFRNLKQIADVPQVGPERFTEIVKAFERTSLREISSIKQPRKTRAKNLRKARLQLLKNYDKVIKLVGELGPEFRRQNEIVEEKYIYELKKIQEREETIPFTWKQRMQIDASYRSRIRHAYIQAFYQRLQEETESLGACEPDIDRVEPFKIRPGETLEFYGTCFGPPKGEVHLKVREGEESCVGLEIDDWKENYVRASLTSLLETAELRPYYGKIWLETGSGEPSNSWPMMFEPIYSFHKASWWLNIGWDVNGTHDDRVALKKRTLGDPDFTVVNVERKHEGNGSTWLIPPHAACQILAQGYHISMPSWQGGKMKLTYTIKGPKGIQPKHIPELGPWARLYDE